MAIYGYTKNYKLIKPQFDTDTWHDYVYDNLDTIDAIMSAIYSSGNWQGFWKKNTHYDVGDVIIDQNTDTMYKVLVEHTTSENTFALEQAAHPTYYELWSPNNLAESWAIKMDGVVDYTDYSAKAYAISSELIDAGSAKEWAIKTDDTVGTTGEYSAKKHAQDAYSSAGTATSQASSASASATLAQKWATDNALVASTDYSAKEYAVGSLDAGSAKDWAIKEGGQVGTTGKYSAKVYSLAAENHYEKARDWASKTNGQVESTDYSAKAYAASSGLVPTGSAKEWATSTSIVADGKYGASYYALQAYNANVSAQNNKTLSQEWASKTDAQVASTDYSSKAYAQSEGLISSGSSKEWATKSSTWAEGTDTDVSALGGTHSSKGWTDNSKIWAEGTDEQVQALGGTHSSKVWAEQSTNANIDLSNLSSTGESHFCNPALTNSPYTTNRILEIPQDVKLELNNGTLTLKAGSKVYVPNGFEQDGVTPKFDVVTISNDLIQTVTTAVSSSFLVVYIVSLNTFWAHPYSICFSGATQPVGYSDCIWYDTTNNIVKVTGNSFSTYVAGALPIAVVSQSGSGVTTSIDQVFNGFGYIGSTIFALPMKGQATTAINSDGTTTSTTWETTTVQTLTVSTSGSVSMSSSGVLTAGFNEVGCTKLADITYYSSRIQGVKFYDVAFVANSNASNFSAAGRSYLSGLSMPSSKYIELTLGASGTAYTAPANGYFAYLATATAAGQYANLSGRLESMQTSAGNTFSYKGFIPVSKGETINFGYTMNVSMFRFVYAEGEN